LGTMLWLWNLWRTFNAADAAQRARTAAGARNLPTLDG
jgi:hypothetical protein